METPETNEEQGLESALPQFKRSIERFQLDLELNEIKTPEKFERQYAELKAGLEEAEALGASESEYRVQFTEWKEETLPELRTLFDKSWTEHNRSNIESAKNDFRRWVEKGPARNQSISVSQEIDALRKRLDAAAGTGVAAEIEAIENDIPKWELEAHRTAVERNLGDYEELISSADDETFQKDYLNYWIPISDSLAYLKDHEEDVESFKKRFEKLGVASDKRYRSLRN